MSFATEKEKVASERFMLVRFSAKLDVRSDYESFAYGRKVAVTGVPTSMYDLVYNSYDDSYTTTTFTQVFTAPVATMSPSTWYYDEATSYVYYNVNADHDTYTYRTYLNVQEFVTGNVARYAPTDPESAGTDVLWKPLLSDYPEVTYAIDDLAVGILSISSGSISIINDGNIVGQYLKSGRSLYGQEVKIWQCITDVSNISLIYSGNIASATISQGLATINLLDSQSALNRSAVFDMIEKGHTAETLMIAGSTKSIRSQDTGLPIHRHFCRLTPFLQRGDQSFEETLYQGICTSYSGNLTNTVNREWVCGIVSQNAGSASTDYSIPTQSFSGLTRAAVNANQAYFYFTSMSNVYKGHTITWTESSTTYYGHVVQTANFTYSGQTYNLAVNSWDGGTPAASASSTMTANKAISVKMEVINGSVSNPPLADLVYGRDFTVALSTLGHALVTLVNAFETNFTGYWDGNYTHPDITRMFYAYAISGDLDPAKVLDNILTAAGLTIDSTTFSSVASTLTEEACFSIPARGDTDFGTYADHAARILESIGGYIRVNASNQVECHLFAAPASGTAVTASEFKNLTIDVDYQDQYDKVVVDNPEFVNDKYTDLALPSWVYFKNRSLINRQLRELVDARRTKEITSVIDRPFDLTGFTGYTDTETRLLWLNSNRRVRITLTTATRHIDALPGDDITVEANNLPGGAASMNFKIVRKTTTGKYTTVEALDLATYP